MAQTQRTGISRPSPDVLKALAHRRRRTVLDILDRRSSVRSNELVSHVVAAETGKPRDEVTQEEAADVLLSLRHIHLPKLQSANLITRHEGLITATGHPALAEPRLKQLVQTDADDWDDVLACLADRYRRIVLSTLHDQDGPMDRRDLAGSVAGRLATGPTGGREIAEDEVRLQLHHRHLPMLDSTGLIEYDPASGTAKYVGHPDLDEHWL